MDAVSAALARWASALDGPLVVWEGSTRIVYGTIEDLWPAEEDLCARYDEGALRLLAEPF